MATPALCHHLTHERAFKLGHETFKHSETKLIKTRHFVCALSLNEFARSDIVLTDFGYHLTDFFSDVRGSITKASSWEVELVES